MTFTDQTHTSEIAPRLCLGCACFCHDLTYTAEGQILDSKGCKLAHQWQRSQASTPVGSEPEMDEAVRRISLARQLKFQIAFTGLQQLSLESQKLALSLAERLGAWVFSGDGQTRVDPWAMAFAQNGGWFASWTEIHQRSDGLIQWFAPLWKTHPRWLERFGPRAGKSSVMCIDQPDDDTSGSGLSNHQLISLDPGHAAWFLADLGMALNRGTTDGMDHRIRQLVEIFQKSKWLTWLRSEDPQGLLDPVGIAESITTLIKQANTGRRRMVMAEVPQGGLTPAGLKAVLSWRTGLAAPMWFSPEGPVYRPGEFSADDANLVVSFGDRPTLKTGQSFIWFNTGHSDQIPINAPSLTQISLARLGSGQGGTIVRADGVTLHVAPMLTDGSQKTAEELLSRILNSLELEAAQSKIPPEIRGAKS